MILRRIDSVPISPDSPTHLNSPPALILPRLSAGAGRLLNVGNNGCSFHLLSFFALIFSTALAMEKDGLRVEVVPKTLSDASAPTSSFHLISEVNQDMALKAAFKNISMKDAPEGTIDYAALVRRWAGNRTSSVYRGTQKLPAMRFGEEVWST